MLAGLVAHPRLLVGSVFVAASGGACGSEPGEPTPDAVAVVLDSVRYRVDLESHDGFVVTVDGVPLDPTSTGIEVTFFDYATAVSAPPFRIETRIGDAIVDAIDIGIGACAWHCDQVQSEECLGQPTASERVSVSYDENGVFEGGAVTPRVWLGPDCTWCTFQDGYNFVVCP